MDRIGIKNVWIMAGRQERRRQARRRARRRAFSGRPQRLAAGICMTMAVMAMVIPEKTGVGNGRNRAGTDKAGNNRAG